MGLVDVEIFLLLGIFISYSVVRFIERKSASNYWNGACYVERVADDKLAEYIRAEYLTVLPGGKKSMGIELIQAWR